MKEKEKGRKQKKEKGKEEEDRIPRKVRTKGIRLKHVNKKIENNINTQDRKRAMNELSKNNEEIKIKIKIILKLLKREHYQKRPSQRRPIRRRIRTRSKE
jgi:hypothetical protein